MAYIKLVSSIVALAALTACGTTNSFIEPVIKKEIVKVEIPVTVPCISEDGKPAKVTPLKDKIPESTWSVLPTGSKAEAVKAQTGRYQIYTKQLDAATAGCK